MGGGGFLQASNITLDTLDLFAYGANHERELHTGCLRLRHEEKRCQNQQATCDSFDRKESHPVKFNKLINSIHETSDCSTFARYLEMETTNKINHIYRISQAAQATSKPSPLG